MRGANHFVKFHWKPKLGTHSLVWDEAVKISGADSDFHRQAIPKGRVAYEPNSLGGGCPFQAGAAGFVSFPQPMEGDKLRAKPEKFSDHYTQATLFYESQTWPCRLPCPRSYHTPRPLR
jgi:catalase